MSGRVGTLWGSWSRYEQRSLSSSLMRGGYALASIPIVLAVGSAISRSGDLGTVMFRLEAELALILCVLLAHFQGSDWVGDSRSGTPELVAVSGISEGRWLLFQLARIWTNFLLVWSVRAPLVAFIGTLGGITSDQWLHKELLLLLLFACCSTLSLIGSHSAATRQKAWGRLLVMVFSIELIGSLPMLILSLWRTFLGTIPQSRWVQAIDSWPPFGFFAASSAMFSGAADPWELRPTAAVYALIALAGLLWLRPRVFLRMEIAEVHSAGGLLRRMTTGRMTERPSRRCWDDALAWQAFACHGAGFPGMMIKSAAYAGVAGLLAWIYVVGHREFAAVMAGAWACGALLHSVNKPADCLNREVRDKTLSTLALLPVEPMDFYYGWRRGSWVIAIPDLVVFLTLCPLFAIMSPPALPIVVTIGGIILAMSPLLTLSAVTSWTPSGVVTGVIVVLGLCALIVFCIVIAANLSSWIVPAFAIPVTCGYGWLIRRFALPVWIRRKIEQTL